MIELPVDEQLPGNNAETLQKYRDEEVGFLFIKFVYIVTLITVI